MEFQPGKIYSMIDLLGGYVTCDGENCDARSDASLTSTQALSQIKDAGWLVRGGKHYCPKCKAKIIDIAFPKA